MSPKQAIPSMFHRRLLLLSGLLLIPVLAMAGQLARLTVGQGEALRADAERRLVDLDWTPTVRGRVLDRHGRVLAKDRPSYDIEVDYRVITGAWAEREAGRYARRRHRDEWPELGSAQRSELIERYAAVYRSHLDVMWLRFADAAGIEPAELESRRAGVVERVDRMFGSIVARRRAELEREAVERRLARGLEVATEIEDTLDAGELASIERRATRPIREQREAHAVANRVADSVAFAFLRLADEEVVLTELDAPGVSEKWIRVPAMPGLGVVDAGAREYPFERVTVDVDVSTLPMPIIGEGVRSLTVDGVATQMLGWMRSRPYAEDAAQRSERIQSDEVFARRVLTESGIDRGRYREGDAVGASGIESSYEHELRGLRGLQRRSLESGEVDETAPEPGRDVTLTIDAMLQARVQAAMTPELGLAQVQDWHGENNPTMPLGTPIRGGAVVLDIATGEILAMVSTPTFTRAQLEEDPASIFEDAVELPHLDRAAAVPYQPGSIVKPLIYCHAVRAGVVGVDEGHVCTGHFLPNRQDVMRCWVYRARFGFTTHSRMYYGDDDALLTPAEAIMGSCNIFFYDLGRKLGRSGVLDFYRDYGVGERFDLGVGIEHPGTLGPGGDPAKMEPSDSIFLGIGQGPVDWTPLHAAEGYAALARDGVWLKPRLVRDGKPPVVRDLGLDPAAIEHALEGLLWSVADERGTGHHITMGAGTEYSRREPIFNVPTVTVWGKTGTAQASPRVVDPDGDGPMEPAVVRRGDHSWFVVLTGPKTGPMAGSPMYAVSVVMEYAGSGGRVSGPIVNQIVHALVAEGYL